MWLRIGLEVSLLKASLISIVDDDASVRTSIGRLMRSLGHTVATFSSAATFLTSPGIEETCCLIVDINMPEMTGTELFRHLLVSGYAIPTIFITAYPDNSARDRALRDGAVCYLPKPFDDAALLLCLQEALERDGSRPAD